MNDATKDATTGTNRSEHDLPTADPRATWRLTWSLLRPRMPLATVALLVLLGSSALGLMPPVVLGWIVDDIGTRGDQASLVGPVVLLLLVAIGQGGAAALGDVLVSRVGEPALAALRERVVDRALHLPAGWLERAGSGDLLARVSGDVEKVADGVRKVLPTLGASALSIAVTLVGLAALDWRFALAMLCALPIQLHTLQWYLGRAAPVYAGERRAEGHRAQQLLDTVGGASTVRAFRLIEDHLERVRRTSEDAMELTRRAVALQTRFFGRLNAAEFVGLAAILGTGFWLVNAEQASVGQATAAALMFARLFGAFNMVLFLVDVAQSAGAGLARLVGVAELPPPSAPADALAPADGSVAVRDLHYAYPGREEVLHGVDLDIAVGERVALVGASGAGKTTLARLIAGLHTVRGDGVRLGGVPIDRIDGAALRRTVAVVSQEVHVFNGTLAEDLRLARPDADEDELTAALDLVGAADWVAELPDGLATEVGTGAHRLTPTQSQQLALARLALADPALAVLDEATAEAGSSGARVLDEAADRVLTGRTALVIAHRLTQAARSDRIVVLDRGKVVESGGHEELIAAGGTYATLWRAWSS